MLCRDRLLPPHAGQPDSCPLPPTPLACTDFQDLTEIKVTLTPAGADPLDPSAHAVPPPSPGAHRACVPGLVGTPVGSPRDGAASPRGATSPRADGAGAAVPVVPAPAVAVYEAAADASLATSLRSCRPVGNSQPGGGPTIAVRCLRHTITSDVPEDAEVAAIVEVGRWLLSMHSVRCTRRVLRSVHSVRPHQSCLGPGCHCRPVAAGDATSRAPAGCHQGCR